ncbi:MAG: phage holin family protein [Wenzhouxiangella sp.]
MQPQKVVKVHQESDPDGERINEDRPTEEAGGEPSAEARAVDELRELIDTASNMARDFLELLALEGRLAGRSLALIVGGGLVLALLVPATWTLLNFALGLWLTSAGILSAPLALLLFAIANIVLGILLWLWIRRLSKNLVFPELLTAISDILPGQHKDTND